jgi:hypothetical protein
MKTNLLCKILKMIAPDPIPKVVTIMESGQTIANRGLTKQ